jgi:Lecithin retinol acyltransferase
MNWRMHHAAPRTHERPLEPDEEPTLAAHLLTSRRLYTHHGLYVGGHRVIHYAGFCEGLQRGPVEEVSLERFAHGRGIRVRDTSPRFAREEVLRRARRRLGERRYRVLSNNCEHFCEWCLHGESRSSQVESLLRLLRYCIPLAATLRLLATPAHRGPARGDKRDEAVLHSDPNNVGVAA